MPEASMDEDRNLSADEGDVRCSRQIFPMDSEAKPCRVQC